MSTAPMPTALTVTAKETALALFPPRLYWRGIAVSQEFQEYAARVARGEQLAPYRGEVLSRYCPSFPWSESTALGMCTAPTPTLPKYPERRRSLKTTLWLVTSVGSIMAALGFGAGATAIDARDEEALELQPFRVTAALTPARAVARPVAELESRAPDGEFAGSSSAAASLAAQDQGEPIATAVASARRPLAPPSHAPRPSEARAPMTSVDRAGSFANVGPAAALQGAAKALGTTPTVAMAPASRTAAGVSVAPGFGTTGVSATTAPSATPTAAALRSPYAATPAYPSTTPYAPHAAYGPAAPAPGTLPGANRPTIAGPPAGPFVGVAPGTVGGVANAPAGASRAAETPSRDTALFSDQPSF
jgi:hypothetical protein